MRKENQINHFNIRNKEVCKTYGTQNFKGDYKGVILTHNLNNFSQN